MHTWHHSKGAPEIIPIDLGFQDLNPILVCSGRSNDTHLVDATGAEVPIEYVELRCQWLRWKSAGLASRSATFVLDVHPTGRNQNQFWGFMIWIVWNWMLRNWIGELRWIGWWICGWTVASTHPVGRTSTDLEPLPEKRRFERSPEWMYSSSTGWRLVG